MRNLEIMIHAKGHFVTSMSEALWGVSPSERQVAFLPKPTGLQQKLEEGVHSLDVAALHGCT